MSTILSELKRVEIELHSVCNRKCKWCTNAYTDRPVGEMSDETFTSILTSLKNEGFHYKSDHYDRKIITLNGYSEPMLDVDLLKRRVNEIRETFPTVEPNINTSGDFLTKENLDGLYVEFISLMDYDCKGRDYWKKKLTDAGCFVFKAKEGEVNKLYAYHKNITQIVVFLDWPEHVSLQTRGGFLLDHMKMSDVRKYYIDNDNIKRTNPCFEPIFDPVINYDGNVMMCCHVRADVNPELILGNVNDTPLEEIYMSEKWVKLREDFESKDLSKYPDVCSTCTKKKDINDRHEARIAGNGKMMAPPQKSTNEMHREELQTTRSLSKLLRSVKK